MGGAQAHKESAPGSNEPLRSPPKDPYPTSRKNRRPHKELYQTPPGPTGNHSNPTRADHAAQPPVQPPSLPDLQKRCSPQALLTTSARPAAGGSPHIALHPHPHQNLQPPRPSAPPSSPHPQPNGQTEQVRYKPHSRRDLTQLGMLTLNTAGQACDLFLSSPLLKSPLPYIIIQFKILLRKKKKVLSSQTSFSHFFTILLNDKRFLSPVFTVTIN